LKEIKETGTRLIRSTLPSGTEFAAVTNLPESITAEEISSVYFERLKIEESYNTLKNKLKFESVTEKASIYVYQDFPAQMLVYNMGSSGFIVENTGISYNQGMNDKELYRQILGVVSPWEITRINLNRINNRSMFFLNALPYQREYVPNVENYARFMIDGKSESGGI
jgi:hypothetical protein